MKINKIQDNEGVAGNDQELRFEPSDKKLSSDEIIYKFRPSIGYLSWYAIVMSFASFYFAFSLAGFSAMTDVTSTQL